MKHNYIKLSSLLFLISFLVCSSGIAQTPFPKQQPSNLPTAVVAPTTKQVKKQNPTAVQNKVGINSTNSVNGIMPKEVSVPKNATELSQKDSEMLQYQITESQDLLKQNGDYYNSNTNPQDTTGTNVKVFKKSANLTVNNIFEVKKEAFKLNKADNMQLQSTSNKYGRTVVTYQQTHDAVPVEGAIYKVRESKNKIEAFGFTTDKLNTNTNYKVNAQVALDNALKSVNAKQYLWESEKLSSLVRKDISEKPAGDLVFVGPNFAPELKVYHLAWKFDVYATNPQTSQTIYVDANSGKVILTIDLQRDTQVHGKGKSRYAGEVTFNTEQYADGYRLEGLQGKYQVPVYTLNMNHADFPADEVITDFIDEDNIWDDLHNENRDEAAIDIHWGMQNTIDYFTDKFDRNSVDNEGMTIFGLAHLGENVANASWTGGWAQFGDGNNAPYVGLGITAHELTHAVTQFSANLIYSGESGALNESFSDIFGVSVEFYAGKDSEKDIWLLGDELYVHGSMRNMSNPNAEEQPDTYGGQYWVNPQSSFDYGGVHFNSGVSNYWFYLLSVGGEGVNDNNDAYNITAIGLEKAEKIAYITLTEYLSPASNFADMRQATLMATEDLYGLGSDEYEQVTNAWYAVGVGAAYNDKQLTLISVVEPEADCGPLTGTEPFYVTVRNTGTSTIKADEPLHYKLRSLIQLRGRFYEIYSNASTVSLANDLEVGQEGVLTIADNIEFFDNPSVVNFVEVKLDIEPVEEFGSNSGVSFVSSFTIENGYLDFDLAMKSVNLPKSNGELQSASNPLSVILENLGCAEIPSGTVLKVGYSLVEKATDTIWKYVTLSESLLGTATLEVTFDETIDLSTHGKHTVEAYVMYDEDSNVTNNTNSGAVFSGVINEFPYIESFERTPGGWNTESLKGAQEWTWQKTSHQFRDTPSEYMWASRIDEDLAVMAPSSDFTLESPILDFTNVESPFMQFDMMWIFFNGTDGLIIEYSDDLGDTWHKAENLGEYTRDLHYNDLVEGHWFTGINNQTQKDPLVLPLNQLAGKKGMVRFRVLTDENVDKYLGALVDNIVIGEAPYDVAILKANLNAGECDKDYTSGTVEVSLTNYFPTNAENLVFTTQVLNNQGEEVFAHTETSQVNFTKYNDTISYSITPKINLSDIGEYQILVSAFPEQTEIDEMAENNSLAFFVDVWEREDYKVSSLPYMMDFEDENGFKGWSTSENKGANGWQHGARADLGSSGWFIADHTKFMASNDDKCNCDSANDMLISPVFDLSNYNEAYLSFDGFGDVFQTSDGYVKVSTDGGETWETIFQMPYISAWKEYDVDLSEYAGNSCVQIAFVHDDNNLFASGFAVDNIEVTSSSLDLEVTNFSTPNKMYSNTTSHEFFLSVKNIGFDIVDTAVLEYQIYQNGNPVGSPIELEKNATIFQNQTVIYLGNNFPNLEAGVYEIKAMIKVEGEDIITNNTATATIEVVNEVPALEEVPFSNFNEGALFGEKGWFSNEGDANYPWKVVVNHENPYLTMPKTDHTGDEQAMMLYNQLEGDKYYAELRTSFYQLPENATGLQFYYASQSNALNAIILDIKVEGEEEWTEIWRVSNQGNHRDREWQKAMINIQDYKGSSVMFRMRHAKANGYSYAAIDDFGISQEPLTDVALEIVAPRDICGTGEEVVVKVTNKGQTFMEANSITLNLEYLNNNENITEVVEESLDAGESIEYTFKTQPTLEDSIDSHIFTIDASIEGDEVQQNNIVKDYVYQQLSTEFKIFDAPLVYGYSGKTMYLDAETNVVFNELQATSYTWSTGVKNNGITVTAPGTYTVTVAFANGCEVTESVEVVYETFESQLASGDVCGPEVVLYPGEFDAYEWLDGSTEPTYTATQDGDYYVTVYKNGVGKVFNTNIAIVENIAPVIKVYKNKEIRANMDAAAYQWYLNGKAIPNSNSKAIMALWEGNYTLEVTNSNGCSSMSEPFDSDGLIVGKLTKPFRVFPNPTEGDLHIFFAQETTGEVQINVYSTSGQNVLHGTFSSMPEMIDLGSLENGIYIVECIVNGEKHNSKVVKK